MMARWLHTVELGDVWRNADMTFEQRRDVVVGRIKSSAWFVGTDDHELIDVVDDLEHAAEAGRFDVAWEALYDIADYDRVWLDTFPKSVTR